MADGATVDPQSLHVIFGAHRLSGRAKGQYVSFSRNVEQNVANVGVDGEGFFVKNADRSGRLNVALQQSARSNLVMSMVHNLDLETPGGIVQPCSVVEQNGSTVIAAARAKIVKVADANWSDGGEVRLWTIEATTWDVVIGDIAATLLNPNPIP